MSKKKDFTEKEKADAPILESHSLRPDQNELKRGIVALGREIVALVKEGKIQLSRSKLIGNRLFVCSDRGFYVLSPDDDIKVSLSAEEDSDCWPYEGLMENFEDLKKTLVSWRDEAINS